MKKFSLKILGLFAVVIIFGLSGCKSGNPGSNVTPAAVQTIVSTEAARTLTDGLGRQVQFEQPVKKIISIAPSNTEILYAIGAGSQLVGRDEFSDFPEEAKKLPNIGGGFGALDTETMISLKPDLVLASQLTPKEQVEAIEKLGLKVYLLQNPVDIESMLDNLKTVGIITGQEKQAEELIKKLQDRVKAVDEKLAGLQEKPLVFYQLDSTDPNAPWTAGQGSFIDTLITRSGGKNLGSELPESYSQLSIEKILVDQPDVIIVGDYTWGGVTADAVMAREAWSGLDAIKNGKVFTFDDNLVSRPGPRLVDGLEAMAKLLHPDLFK